MLSSICMPIWSVHENSWHNDNLIEVLQDNRSGMFFSVIPPPAEVTRKNKFPFELTFFTHSIHQPEIKLYSQFSNSRPYQDPQSKWGHLLPQWRFCDLDGNVIDTVKPDYDYVYSGTEVVGITGKAQFYYVDDLPTKEDCPLYLWATMDMTNLPVPYDLEKQTLPGHANSLVTTRLPYTINGQPPAFINITRNGEDPFLSPRWTDIQFPYVVTIHGDLLDGICDGIGTPIIFDYPQSNAIGASAGNEVNRTLTHVATGNQYDMFLNDQQDWVPDTQYFQRYDDSKLHIGGFVRGLVTSFISSDNAAVFGDVQVQYYPWFREQPYVWVSNPENRNMNILRLFPIRDEDCPDESQVGEFVVNGPYGNKINVTDMHTITSNIFAFDTPYVTTRPDPMALSGFGGIFGIAVDPCYDAWTTDSEMDAIFKFSPNGDKLKSIYLKETPEIIALDPTLSGDDIGLTPVGVAVDRIAQVWVTLFDFVSTLKFDQDGNFLFATQPIGAEAPEWQRSGDPDWLYDPLYKGPQVDTDLDNNAWVTYSNHPNSILVKYDGETGAVLNTVNMQPNSATPIDILVDGSDNSVWVTNAYSHHLSGNIQHYDTNGSLISTWWLPYYPSYLTIDRYQNIWFTYGYNSVGKLHSTSTAISSFVCSANNFISQHGTDIPSWWNIETRLDSEALQGIACDTRNNIWIINSLENRAYVIDANTTNFIDPLFTSFLITPNANISWNNDTGQFVQQYEYYHEWNESAQAFGDWTGYRWIQKYIPYNDELITTTLSAISNEFEITPFSQQYCIRRFNESWDATQQVRDYAISEHIHSFHKLWEQYIGNMIGGLECEQQSLGRQSYERIANFGKNHVDIDAANVTPTHTLAQQLDVPTDNYDFEFPPDLQRIMDIAAVPHHKLWGARCKCNKHFGQTQVCEHCGHIHSLNRGKQFNSSTYMVTAGVPFLVRFSFGPEYIRIEPQYYNTSAVYPLSATSSMSWLNSSEYWRYQWYEFIPTYCNQQVEGIINWGDEYTTLLESNSSLEEWYGDNGILERIISYELYKGLGY